MTTSQYRNIGPHRHQFDTNVSRTERTCKLCGAHQQKISGKWKPAKEER